jgi:HTH-type transcriptional regulator/antitoxin HigA
MCYDNIRYVLFAWQRMCELLTDNIDVAEEVNLEMLRKRIPEIKQP